MRTDRELPNRLEAAYTLGMKYKAIGMMKVCPLYEDLVAEQYFFAGYDGKPIAEVGKTDDAAQV